MAAHPVPVAPSLDVPKGNWIARNLRMVNDDSRQLFPPSSHGSRAGRGDKFHTLYKKDYQDYPEADYLEGLREKGAQPKRETIRDVLFGNSPGEMFAAWKVPPRIVPVIPDIQESPRQELREMAPMLERSRTLPNFRTDRQSRLLQPSPSMGSRADTQADLGTRQRLRNSLQDHTVTTADEWLKNAPLNDKKVIERVLRMQEKQHQLDNAMRKSLQPDARVQVEGWLEAATDAERQVALKFFTSVAGARLMGSTPQEQKGRLQQVIRTLKANKGHAPPVRRSLDSSMIQKQNKLKYINLLDPQTRSERSQHTTWHHLPEYKDLDRVNNWSSHFTMPNAPAHRHFVIHPDWG